MYIEMKEDYLIMYERLPGEEDMGDWRHAHRCTCHDDEIPR